MIAYQLRDRARTLLYCPRADMVTSITLGGARLCHAEAVECRDEEAIALWARIIWRLVLEQDRRYEWLERPVRPEYRVYPHGGIETNDQRSAVSLAALSPAATVVEAAAQVGAVITRGKTGRGGQ